MKRLLFILSAVFTLTVADGQMINYRGDTLSMILMPNGQYAQVWRAKNWQNIPVTNRHLAIFYHGQGEKGNGASDTAKIRIAGTLAAKLFAGYIPPYGVFCISPQLATSKSFWDDNDETTAINFMAAKFGLTVYKNHFRGYSLGGTEVANRSWDTPERYASAHVIAGSMNNVNTSIFSPSQMKKIGGYMVTYGSADVTQNMSNGVKAWDSSNVINRTGVNLMQTDFYFGPTHSAIDDTVANKIDQYIRWDMLFDTRADTTARLHVDSLEKGFDDGFYRETKRRVDSLPAGSFKTGLQARVAAAANTFYRTGWKEIIVNPESTSETIPGVNSISSNTDNATVSNLKDVTGATTSYSFKVNSRGGHSVKRSYPDDLTGYFGFPDGVMNDAFQFNHNTATHSFNGLNDAKKYAVLIYYYKKELSSGTNYSSTFTINGVSKPSGFQYRNSRRYVAFYNLSPTSGTISVSMAGVVTNSENEISAYRLIEYGEGGNASPVVDAGGNKEITLPTSSVTVTGTATDADGSIVSVAWTKVSGPGTQVIASPSSNSTLISGLVAGTYEFKYKATDNLGATAEQNITVLVNPALNVYPTANAGIDRTITQPKDTVQLHGTASDADGSIEQYSWSQVGTSPAVVSFTGPNTANPTVNGLTAPGQYTIQLEVTDDDGATTTDVMQINVAASGGSVQVSAGADVDLPWDQGDNTKPVTRAATIIQGTVTSWSWTQISGPTTATITGATTQIATFSNLKKGGYAFRVSVNSNAAADTFTVGVRSLQDMGLRPCRVGAPVVHLLGNVTGNGITATDLYYPAITASNRMPLVMGGDIIKIVQNPNSPDGRWNRIELGDISGNIGCPIRIVPDGKIIIRPTIASQAAMAYGIRDSNKMSYVIVDGLYNYDSDGIEYGFDIRNPLGFGVSANLVDHFEIAGVAIHNTTTGLSIKIVADSTKPYRVYDNYRMTGIKIHHTLTDTTVYEAMYLGNTNPSGGAQGNKGIPNRGDSVEIYYNTCMNNGWDAIQTSFMGYCWIHHNLSLNSNTSMTNDQEFAMFNGGLTRGIIEYNFMKGMAEGPAMLGMGVNIMRYNGIQGSSVVYVSQSNGGTEPVTVDSMQNFIYGNILKGHIGTSAQIRVANDQGTEKFKKGAIRDNILEDTRAIGSVITSAYGDTIENNTILSNVDFDSYSLMQSLEPYQLSKWIDAHPDQWPSYFKLENPTNEPPIMNAGSAQDITLPVNSATLTGSGSDPDGTIPSHSWSKASGPSGGTITDASSYTTTVTSLVQGVYKFVLTGTDNDGAVSTDTVQINVLPNLPPTVDAGLGITLTLPVSSTTLAGTATDPEGGPLTYTWSKLYGPGTPVISNAASPITTVSGLVEGEYMFRLSVVDNVGNTVTGTIAVTVLPAPIAPPVEFEIIFRSIRPIKVIPNIL